MSRREGEVPVFEVWVDTRVDGEVVQVVFSRQKRRRIALDLVNRINTMIETYPNMVAWVVVDSIDANKRVKTPEHPLPVNLDGTPRKRRAAPDA